MLIGTNTVDGTKCVYDLPAEIETAEQMNSLIYDYNRNPANCEELQGQPKLKGLNGPMFNGFGTLASTGETIAIIRYEKPSRY